MRDALLGNYLIGLREGLEGVLVVSILVAFLVKSGRRARLGQVWLGVGAAVVLSVLFGAVLHFVAQDLLGHRQREVFEAVTSIAAVGLVTWMVFWMRSFARSLAGELRGRLERAIGVGALAVVAMAFLAVAREGLETALLFYAAAQGARTTAVPLIGLLTGIGSAVALGWLLYRGAIRINLATFFRWTGALLILVAAGILKYGVHGLQEAGLVPGVDNYAFDISGWYDPASWYGALLQGMFNITATPSMLESIAWAGYAAVTLVFFLRPSRPAPVPPSRPAPVTASPSEPVDAGATRESLPPSSRAVSGD